MPRTWNIARTIGLLGTAYAALTTTVTLAQGPSKEWSPRVDAIKKKVETELPSLEALYKQLHTNPELAFHEEKSAARVAKASLTPAMVRTSSSPFAA
jgi:hippurate hydrolase